MQYLGKEIDKESKKIHVVLEYFYRNYKTIPSIIVLSIIKNVFFLDFKSNRQN